MVLSKGASWAIILANVIIQIIGQCDKNLVALGAVPISKEFGLSSTEIGLIMSVFFLGYVPMNVVGGFLTDKYGSRKVILVTVVLFSIFTGVTGLAWSFASLLLIRFVFGIAEGSFTPAYMRIVAEIFPKEKRGLPGAFLTSGSKLGIGIGAIVTTQLILLVGWRHTFLIFCLCGFALVTFFAWISRGMKSDVKEQQKTPISYSAVFKVPDFWKICIINFSFGALLLGLNSWMPSYWMHVRGLKLDAMGFASAIPPLVAFVVMVGVGYQLDRYLMGKEKTVIAAGALIGAVGIYCTYVSPTVLVGVVCSTVASIGGGIMQAATMVCIVKYFPMKTVGAGLGIANASTQLAGVLLPAAFGYTLSLMGGSYVIIFGFMTAIFALVSCLALTINIKGIMGSALADGKAAL